MARFASSDAAAPDIDTSTEDTARLSFEAGGASFMLNYPFVYPSAKENAPDVFKQLEATTYPAVVEGEPSAPPLGGINLGVSEFSENSELAFEAAACMVGPENQLEAAKLGGLPPTREDLYEDKAIEEAYPGFSDLIKESIDASAPRPLTPAYTDLSLAIQTRASPDRRHRPRRRRGHLRAASGPGRAGRQAGRVALMADRTKSERKLGWMLCAPAVFAMILVTAYPDRLRARPLAAGARSAVPRRRRLRRPRQLPDRPDLEPVVAGRLQHDLRHRHLRRDRADARDDHRARHAQGDLRARDRAHRRS